MDHSLTRFANFKFKTLRDIALLSSLSLVFFGPVPAVAANPACATSKTNLTLSGVDYITEAISNVGVCDFVVPAEIVELDVLVVAGGGGGGGGASREEGRGGGGGGGGGGVGVEADLAVTPGMVFAVTVGAGGAGGSWGTASASPATFGSRGGTSSFLGNGLGGGVSGGFGGGAGAGSGGAGGNEGMNAFAGGAPSSLLGGSGGNGARAGQASESINAGRAYAGFAAADLVFSDGGAGASGAPTSPQQSFNFGAGGSGGPGAFGGTGGLLRDSWGTDGRSGEPGLVIIRYQVSVPGTPGTPSASVNDTSVALSWTAPTATGGSPITSYKIEQSVDAGANWTDAVAFTGNDATTATISSLTRQTSYLFRVTAINSVGESTVSTASSAALILAAPAPIVADPPAPTPYSGPLITGFSLTELEAGSIAVVSVTGLRFEDVLGASIDGVALELLSKSSERLSLRIPGLTPGKKNLVLQLTSGQLTHQDAFNVVSATPVSAQTLSQKVNAGSFKGFVAVYAKGYEGKRLSAKIGKDWVIVPSLGSNFVRVVDAGVPGRSISVRIFIDRVLVATIPLVTK